jgi:hypothetical protein
VTEFVEMIAMNMVTPKEAANTSIYLFNKPASEASLLNKSTSLAAALGVTKYITMAI